MKIGKHILITTAILVVELLIMCWAFEKYQKGMLLSVAANVLIERGFVIIATGRDQETGNQIEKFGSAGEGRDLAFWYKNNGIRHVRWNKENAGE